MTIDTEKAENKPTKAPRAPGSKTMKMLSMAQANNPMKHAYYGGFQNIAFQTGTVVRLPGDPPNQFYLRTSAKTKHPLPIMLPVGVRAPAHGDFIKVTCTILGATDPQGNPYPLLIARQIAIPNVLEAATRRTIDLQKTDVDPTEASRKQTSVGNDVHLTGIVVGRRLHRRQRENGTFDENQSVTFYLRLDADPTHVIPVVCDKKLAEQANNQVRFGSIISVQGQYHTATVKIPLVGEDGKAVLNEDGTPIYEMDSDGKPRVRFHPFIYLNGYPSNAPDKHMLFMEKGPKAMPMPEWIDTQINHEIRIRAALGKQQNDPAAQPKEMAPKSDALVTNEDLTKAVSSIDRNGGL